MPVCTFSNRQKPSSASSYTLQVQNFSSKTIIMRRRFCLVGLLSLHIALPHHLLCRAQVANIQGLELIDAATNQKIADLRNDGATVYTQNSTAFNVKATVSTSGTAVASVSFDLDGQINAQTENVAPFALCGDVSGVYMACPTAKLGTGPHTITARSYDGPSRSGNAGAPLTVSFVLQPGTAVVGGQPQPTAPPPAKTSAPLSAAPAAKTKAPLPAPAAAAPTQVPAKAPSNVFDRPTSKSPTHQPVSVSLLFLFLFFRVNHVHLTQAISSWSFHLP
jgi:hypothetical protein